MTSKVFLTVDEACDYLGLKSRGALYQRIRRGQVPAHRFGRSLRFVPTELSNALGVEGHPAASSPLHRT